MSPLPGHTGLAVAGLLLNALVFGLSWWPFKQLQAIGLHPLWSTAVVYLLALLALLTWSAWRGQSMRTGWRAHPGLWWLMLASGLTNVGFNWAITVGDVVRVVLLFYLMPAWSVLVAWLLLGERPHGAALLRVALALLGLWIVLKPADAPWPVPQDAADVLALLGGLCFAATNVGLFKLRHSPEPARMMAMFGGGALIPALVALGGSSLGLLAAPPALGTPWWPALVLALGFLVGNLTLQYGAARLSAHTTSLVMLSEVVFAAVSSVALGAAQWQTQTLVGGGLILLAALLAVQPAPARPTP